MPHKPTDLEVSFAARPSEKVIAHRTAARRHDEKIMAALKEAFPYVRHDAAFSAALKPAMEDTIARLDKNCSLTACAYDIRYDLEYYSDHPQQAPRHDYLPGLLKLYPHYQQMAKEAKKDYGRIGVRLGITDPQWRGDPDCWTKRVAQLRGETGEAPTRV